MTEETEQRTDSRFAAGLDYRANCKTVRGLRVEASSNAFFWPEGRARKTKVMTLEHRPRAGVSDDAQIHTKQRATKESEDRVGTSAALFAQNVAAHSSPRTGGMAWVDRINSNFRYTCLNYEPITGPLRRLNIPRELQ